MKKYLRVLEEKGLAPNNRGTILQQSEISITVIVLNLSSSEEMDPEV
jgi:hypothetical protein